MRGGPWTQAAVRRILTNPVHMGYVRHNGEVFLGAHEPIVSEELWHAAEAARESAVRTRGHGGGRRSARRHEHWGSQR